MSDPYPIRNDGESIELARYRRQAFPTLFLALFTAMLGVGIISPILPIYASQMGASGFWIGLIFGGFSLARMTAMPLVGRLSDLHGRKGFLLAGLIFYAVISLTYVYAADYRTLVVLRVLHGLGSAMVVPVAMALIAETAPEGREGEYMGTITIALFAGFGAGPLIGGLLKDRFGMAMNFYSLALLAFLSFLLVLVLLPRRTGLATRAKEDLPRYRDLWRSDLIKSLTIYRFVNALGRGAIMAFLPLFCHVRLGMSAASIGVLLSIYILLISLLQRPFGKLADHLSRPALVVTGTVISAVLFLFLPGTASFRSLLGVLLLMGVAGSLSLPAATAMMVKEGRNKGMGSIMALFNVAFSAGLGTGPLIGGLIRDATGTLDHVFHFAALSLVAGVVLFWTYYRRSLRVSGGGA